jgi:hypothetical protein
MWIKNVNFIELHKTLKDAKKTKNKTWRPVLGKDFIGGLLAVFAAVPLVKRNDKYWFGGSMQALKEPVLEMPIKQIEEAIRFIYLCPRSWINLGKQTENPKHASYTPLFLYAHKLYNDINYEEWDKDDPALKLALGSFLEPILTYEPIEVDVVELRKEMLTVGSGKDVGTVAGLTAYKSNKNSYGIHSTVARMLAQTWVCNAALRDQSSMILDPINWDNVPEPLDAVSEKKADEVQISDSDIPWI